jgi:uncharacterized membrane protein
VAERRARLDQPNLPRRGPRLSYDPEAFGRLTERIARFLGTGRYLILQTVLIVVWILFNTVPGLPHFDPYQFLFLTLILSLQAAYSAPLILLAQNRQDDRDRVNLDEDRGQARQAGADAEYLAREIAAIRIALGDVVTRDYLRSELIRFDRTEDTERDKDRHRDREKDRDRERRKEKDRAKAQPKAQPTDPGSSTPDPVSSTPPDEPT